MHRWALATDAGKEPGFGTEPTEEQVQPAPLFFFPKQKLLCMNEQFYLFLFSAPGIANAIVARVYISQSLESSLFIVYSFYIDFS